MVYGYCFMLATVENRPLLIRNGGSTTTGGANIPTSTTSSYTSILTTLK